MKRATAIRTGPETYCVRFGKTCRECRYRFLLALARGGYRVRLEQDGWSKGRVMILSDSG